MGVPVTTTITLSATWPVDEQGEPDRLAWSPNGRLLAVGFAKGTVQIFSINSASNFSDHPPASLETGWTYGVVEGLAWNGDGSRLASSSEDGTIRLWAGEPLETVAILTGHAASVDGIAWHPDGERLVSASADQTVRLWRFNPWRRQDPAGKRLSAGRDLAAGQNGGGVCRRQHFGILYLLWNLESNRVGSLNPRAYVHHPTPCLVAYR